MRIAILALQGAFLEHAQMLARLGVDTFEVRQPRDWQQPKDALIIPGGESTTQTKLLRDLGLLQPVRDDVERGLPVFGTCAGLILLARTEDGTARNSLATMDIDVCRNAYGRQLGSFHTEADFAGQRVPMTFIRAPYINKVGANVTVLSTVGGKIVAAQQGSQLVTAFHPELDESTAVHEHFLRMARRQARLGQGSH